jgi:acyl-CoA dehydrogenase
MLAAQALGAAERVIEEATAFARERRAYGQPNFGYQAVQFMLADSLTELWAARLMTCQTVHGIDAGVDGKAQHAQCSMAKLYASEMAGRVADRAVQIFGGRGYLPENVAERCFLPRAAGGQDLGGDQRGPAGHRRRPARQAGVGRLTG